MKKKIIFTICFLMISYLSAVDSQPLYEKEGIKQLIEPRFFKRDNLEKFPNALKAVIDYTKKLEQEVSKGSCIKEALNLHNQDYSLPDVLLNIVTITKNNLFNKDNIFSKQSEYLQESIEKLEKELKAKKDIFSKTMGNIYIKAQDADKMKIATYLGKENVKQSGFLLLENEKYLKDHCIIPLIKKFLSDFNKSSKLIQQVSAFLSLCNNPRVSDLEKKLLEYNDKIKLSYRSECSTEKERNIFSSIWTLFHSTADHGAKLATLYDSLICMIIDEKLLTLDSINQYHDYVELKLKASGLDTPYLTRYRELVADFINERKSFISPKNISSQSAQNKPNDIKESILEVNGKPFYFYKKDHETLQRTTDKSKTDKIEAVYKKYNDLMNLINGTNVKKDLRETKTINGSQYVIFNVDPSGLCGWEALGINPEKDSDLVKEIIETVKKSNTYGEMIVKQFGENIENAINSIKAGKASNPTASVGRFIDHPKTWEILPTKININITSYNQDEKTKQYTKKEYFANSTSSNSKNSLLIHAANGHFDLLLSQNDYNSGEIPSAYALTELEYVRKLINDKISKSFVQTSIHFDSMKELLIECENLKKELN